MCSNGTMRIYFDRDVGETSEFSIIENQFLGFSVNGNGRGYFSKELPREKELRESIIVRFYLLHIQLFALYSCTLGA